MDSVVERIVVAIGFRVDSASVRSALGSYAAVASVLATATAAGIGFALSQAAQDDELAKTARSLGVTTEEYTRLTFAMDRQGVSSAQLGTGLRGLQNQLEAASRGSGEAAAWLQKMGISARDANGHVRKAADVLPEIADGLAKLPEGERAAASLRIFGESGAMMGAALAGGREEIDRLMERADALGVTLDSGAAANAEALVDSMTDLRASVTGLGRALVSEVTPALTPLITDLATWLGRSDGIVRSGLDRFAKAAGFALSLLQTDAGKAAAGLGGIAAVMGVGANAGGLLQALSAVSPLLGSVGGKLLASGPAALKYGAALGLLALVAEDVWVTMQGGDSVIRRMAESMGIADEGAKLFGATTEMLGAAWDPLILLGKTAATTFGEDVARGFDAVTGALVQAFPALQPWVDEIREMISLDVGSWMDSLSAGLEKSTRGYRKAFAYMTGSEGVGLNTDNAQGLVVGGIGGLATRARADALGVTPGEAALQNSIAMQGEAARLQQSFGFSSFAGAPQAGPSGGNVTISPNVTVNAESIRAAGREAGRAVERETAAAADSAELY